MSYVPRILSVEDDPDGQELVSTILNHLSIPMDAAYSAEQAEQFLFNGGGPYSAVVIDLALPEKDGWELLYAIQSNPATQNIPCIAVTAYHNSKLREQALQAGFSAYFPKPLDTNALAQQIAAMV
jgi:CheY-like chemotaxis protein